MGVVAGLLVWAGVFALPFMANDSSTLWTDFNNLASHLNYLSAFSGPVQQFDYAVMAAAVVFILAGLLGAWPRASGILGVLGSIVVVGFGANLPGGGLGLGDYGSGYYLILVASIVLLGVGFFWRRPRPSAASTAAS